MSSFKGWLSRPAVVLILVAAAGAISATATAIVLADDPSHSQPANRNSSIDIEMPKTEYNVGERLHFAIDTYGICAAPNVTITRHEAGEALTVYEYVGGPVSCRAENEPDEPHLRWEARMLGQRISNEYVGGDGNSVITTSAAMTLKKAGNYTVSASLLDWSDTASIDFTVTDNGEGITLARMDLVSIEAFTLAHEPIGKVVPQMEFKKGELVLLNATFANPSTGAMQDFILTLGIRDENENPLPDDISIVTGDAAAEGTISIEHSWRPEKV